MAAVKVFQGEKSLRTEGGLSVRDITEDVAEAVRESGVQNGIVCVYSPHTTCCIRVNEFENGFLDDVATLLRRLVPSESYYAHDDWDRRTENICEEDMERGNGHAHCMSMLLGGAGCSFWSSTGNATGAGSSRSSGPSSSRQPRRAHRRDRGPARTRTARSPARAQPRRR